MCRCLLAEKQTMSVCVCVGPVSDPRAESLHHDGRESGKGMGAYGRYREGGNDPSVSCACREAEDLGVRGLWVPDPRPVHHAGGAGPGMARRLPQVRRLLAVPGRVVHVLRSRRQDVLQARLFKVRWTEPRST